MSDLLKRLNKKKVDKADWKTYPILLHWYEAGRMLDVIQIIEEKTNYLLSQGASSKVNEWISSDLALTQITAERYLLDSLRVINSNLEESFTGGGVDAYLVHGGKKIGIEVTTVNQSISEWILRERLLTYLSSYKYSRNDTIEITYDLAKIEGLKHNNFSLVEKIGTFIIKQNFHKADGVSVKKSLSVAQLLAGETKVQTTTSLKT